MPDQPTLESVKFEHAAQEARKLLRAFRASSRGSEDPAQLKDENIPQPLLTHWSNIDALVQSLAGGNSVDFDSTRSAIYKLLAHHRPRGAKSPQPRPIERDIAEQDLGLHLVELLSDVRKSLKVDGLSDSPIRDLITSYLTPTETFPPLSDASSTAKSKEAPTVGDGEDTEDDVPAPAGPIDAKEDEGAEEVRDGLRVDVSRTLLPEREPTSATTIIPTDFRTVGEGAGVGGGGPQDPFVADPMEQVPPLPPLSFGLSTIPESPQSPKPPGLDQSDADDKKGKELKHQLRVAVPLRGNNAVGPASTSTRTRRSRLSTTASHSDLPDGSFSSSDLAELVMSRPIMASLYSTVSNTDFPRTSHYSILSSATSTSIDAASLGNKSSDTSSPSTQGLGSDRDYPFPRRIRRRSLSAASPSAASTSLISKRSSGSSHTQPLSDLTAPMSAHTFTASSSSRTSLLPPSSHSTELPSANSLYRDSMTTIYHVPPTLPTPPPLPRSPNLNYLPSKYGFQRQMKNTLKRTSLQGAKGDTASIASSNPSLPAGCEKILLVPLNEMLELCQVDLSSGPLMFGRALSTEKEKARSGGWILFSSIVVSRNHAQIWSDGGQVFVKDLKSSRGTYLNGVRLSPRKAESHPIPVASGDILQIGKDHFEDTDTTSTDEVPKSRRSILLQIIVVPPPRKYSLTRSQFDRQASDKCGGSPGKADEADLTTLFTYQMRLEAEHRELTERIAVQHEKLRHLASSPVQPSISVQSERGCIDILETPDSPVPPVVPVPEAPPPFVVKGADVETAVQDFGRVWTQVLTDLRLVVTTTVIGTKLKKLDLELVNVRGEVKSAPVDFKFWESKRSFTIDCKNIFPNTQSLTITKLEAVPESYGITTTHCLNPAAPTTPIVTPSLFDGLSLQPKYHKSSQNSAPPAPPEALTTRRRTLGIASRISDMKLQVSPAPSPKPEATTPARSASTSTAEPGDGGAASAATAEMQWNLSVAGDLTGRDGCRYMVVHKSDAASEGGDSAAAAARTPHSATSPGFGTLTRRFVNQRVVAEGLGRALMAKTVRERKYVSGVRLRGWSAEGEEDAESVERLLVVAAVAIVNVTMLP